jgi:tryptophan synthase alpha chain
MSTISQTFQSLKAEGRKALIAYLTVGYPNLTTTLAAVPRFFEAGCDIIELGIPFSDPLADGTTIQSASFAALESGITPRSCIETAGQLRQTTTRPLVFMTYFNPVMHYGLAEFSADCSRSGIDGLIVPDLPPEEGQELRHQLQVNSIDSIYLLAPTSTDERIALVAQNSSGFIYLVALRGVTGARSALAADLKPFVQRVRKATTLPLCVGFGISNPEQAAEVSGFADGVIVGSKLIQVMEKSENPVEDGVRFIASLRKALDSVRQ